MNKWKPSGASVILSTVPLYPVISMSSKLFQLPDEAKQNAIFSNWSNGEPVSTVHFLSILRRTESSEERLWFFCMFTQHAHKHTHTCKATVSLNFHYRNYNSTGFFGAPEENGCLWRRSSRKEECYVTDNDFPCLSVARDKTFFPPRQTAPP